MADNSKQSGQYYFRIDNIDDRSVPLLVNSCGEAIMKENFVTSRKRHDFYLMYVTGGKIDSVCNGKKTTLERGSVICVSPDTSYFYRSSSSSTEYINYSWIHFTGSDAEKTLAACNIPLNFAFEVDIKESVLSLFEELFFEFRTRSEEDDEKAAIILRYILFKIGLSKREEKRADRKLDLSIKYIHTHLASPLSVEELSAMEFLSPSRYREVFRKVTGHSPSEYITLVRLRQACDLLGEGNLSIDETANQVGYTDRLYFQRVFKSHIGIISSPTRGYALSFSSAKVVISTVRGSLSF